MQTVRLALLPSAVLALLTAGYCWLIWLAMGAFSAAMPIEVSQNLPLVSRLTMAPLLPVPFHALHWQLLGVAASHRWPALLCQRAGTDIRRCCRSGIRAVGD